MSDLFRSLLHFPKPSMYNIDNYVFRLHYKFSLIILFGFSVWVTAYRYLNEPIVCNNEYDNRISTRIIETFCWTESTYSELDEIGNQIIYPGIGTESTKKIYHKYYQWVSLSLFVQAIIFYIPRLYWKANMHSKVKALLESKELDSLVINIVKVKGENEKFWKFCFAEILNLVNVICQIIFMDSLFNGKFRFYGLDVFKFYMNDVWNISKWDTDPMIVLFPHIAKCDFFYHPFSQGSLHLLCLLPINTINDKIYLFLWCWFGFLLIFSVAALIYRLFTVISIKFRLWIIQSKCSDINNAFNAFTINYLGYGGWFLLVLLSNNLEKSMFDDLIEKITSKCLSDYNEKSKKNDILNIG